MSVVAIVVVCALVAVALAAAKLSSQIGVPGQIGRSARQNALLLELTDETRHAIEDYGVAHLRTSSKLVEQVSSEVHIEFMPHMLGSTLFPNLNWIDIESGYTCWARCDVDTFPKSIALVLPNLDEDVPREELLKWEMLSHVGVTFEGASTMLVCPVEEVLGFCFPGERDRIREAMVGIACDNVLNVLSECTLVDTRLTLTAHGVLDRRASAKLVQEDMVSLLERLAVWQALFICFDHEAFSRHLVEVASSEEPGKGKLKSLALYMLLVCADELSGVELPTRGVITGWIRRDFDELELELVAPHMPKNLYAQLEPEQLLALNTVHHSEALFAEILERFDVLGLFVHPTYPWENMEVALREYMTEHAEEDARLLPLFELCPSRHLAPFLALLVDACSELLGRDRLWEATITSCLESFTGQESVKVQMSSLLFAAKASRRKDLIASCQVLLESDVLEVTQWFAHALCILELYPPGQNEVFWTPVVNQVKPLMLWTSVLSHYADDADTLHVLAFMDERVDTMMLYRNEAFSHMLLLVLERLHEDRTDEVSCALLARACCILCHTSELVWNDTEFFKASGNLIKAHIDHIDRAGPNVEVLSHWNGFLLNLDEIGNHLPNSIRRSIASALERWAELIGAGKEGGLTFVDTASTGALTLDQESKSASPEE